MIFCHDALTLDTRKLTRDGFLAVRARAARTGVYEYSGAEVDPENRHGLRDEPVVRVLRDERTVFDEAAARSFIGKPVTDGHPSQPVTAANWRDHARGTVMGAMRDGEYLAFDLLLTDAGTIAKVNGGKRELSNGYSTDLEFGEFVATDGTKCQARQTRIVGNHVAIVDAGRAGPECAIKDIATCDAITADELARLRESIMNDRKDGAMPHTLIVDGLQVPNVSDEAKACIEKLQKQLEDEREARAADKKAHDKELAARDAEIDDLKTKVVDQAKIDALADAKAAVVADARKIAGDKLGDTAGKSIADVRRMAVAARLGDAAVADKSDDYIEARFDALKDGAGAGRNVTSLGQPRTVLIDRASIAAARRRYLDAKANAYSSPPASAQAN